MSRISQLKKKYRTGTKAKSHSNQIKAPQIQATIRRPASHVVVSLASMMLATGAMAQNVDSATGAMAQGVELPTIQVQGDGGGYRATNPGLTRIPTPLIDTPQTVNVVTQKLIDDKRASTMEDALRNVPGITFSAAEGGQQGDSPFIRGFVARTDMFRDGVRDPGWYTRDLFSTERVEVYKGPSAFAFGRGATGGAINTVSKTATGAQFVEGTATVSSPRGLRAEFDVSGKMGNVSARIVGLGQDVATPDRDNVWTKRWGLAPSFAVEVNDKTKVSLHYIYQGEDGVPDYGHPWLPAPTYNQATGGLTNPGYYGNGSAVTPIPIPRNFWFGITTGPLRDRVETETHILTAKIERDITDQVKLTNTTRFVSVDRFARVTAPRSLGTAGNVIPPPVGYPVRLMTAGRQRFQLETDNTLLVNQTDLTAKFNTGPLLHTVAAGFEAAQEAREQRRANGMTATNLCDPVAAACRTPVWPPNNSSFGGVFGGWNPANTTDVTNYAAYASDQVKIGRYFELLGAVRYDNFSTTFKDPGNANPLNQNVSRTDNMLSWRAGAVAHPMPNSSVYVAYGVSYNPSAELGTLAGTLNSANNVSLAPEKNRSIEVGAKADFFGGWLSLTGAVFRIEKTNMRIPNDPALPTALQVVVLDGLARVDGIELGVSGKITDKWQVFTGYSYLDSAILRTSNLADRGKQIPNTPPQSFTLWNTYAVTPAFTIGGGAIYQSDTFANTTNTLYVPAFWRFDAMASYQLTSNVTMQLNVNNITNVMYYAQFYTGHAVPAAGRYASLSVRARW